MGFTGGFQVFILFSNSSVYALCPLNHDQHLMFYYMVVVLRLTNVFADGEATLDSHCCATLNAHV
jgi:hypothetical protein